MPVIAPGFAVRPLGLDDAAELAVVYDRNRDHLARWDPVRPETFYTEAGQREAIGRRLEEAERGLHDLWLIHTDDEARAVVGAVNLQNIVRGAMLGGVLGYWVDADHTRRGLATAAVAFAVERARDIGLHRVEAGTMVENVASQGVLRKSGFTQYGLVPQFLFISGGWRDHVLFQRLLYDGPPPAQS